MNEKTFSRIRPALRVAVSCAALLPAAVMAQPRVTSGTDASGVPYSRDYYLTMPDKVGLALLRSAELGQDGFILRLATQDARTSCATYGPLNIETSFDAIYMDVTVASYLVDMRDAPKDGRVCDNATQAPSADILLDRADLQARGISQIRFHYMNYTDRYDIEIGDHYIGFTPAKARAGARNVAGTYGASGGYQLQTPLELWFMPLDTVALIAPAIPQGQNPEEAITTLAKGRGLLPVADSLPGFIPPRTTPQAYYFTDPQNMYLKSLPDDETAQPFAKVQLEHKIYGLRGDEVAYRTYDVYMKKPGVYE